MAKRKRRKKDGAVELVPGNGLPPSDFVGKQEFEEFKSQTSKNTLDILEAIKAISQPTPVVNVGPTPTRAFSVTRPETVGPPPTAADASAERSNYTLGSVHQAIFEEYFDPEDGFTARFDYPYFSIIVPDKFSNADPAWKKYYKVDTRLKFIKYDNVEGGIRDWCKLVAANLKYDKTKKLK